MTQQQDIWLPKGHAERLTVGARVQIRLSPECPVYPPDHDHESQHYHDPNADGTTGRIISNKLATLSSPVHGSDLIGAHRYRVRKDKPGALNESFAATELIVLDDAEGVAS